MRTWVGYVGVVITAFLVAIVYMVNMRGNGHTTELRFEDGGIVGGNVTQSEYIPWRPEGAELSAKDSFGETWEDGIIKDKSTAQKVSPTSKQTSDEHPTQKKQKPQTQTEYVNVGDMWKSNKNIELGAWNTPQEEDATKKAIRAFGNAVGTKIQMLTLSHGKQSDKLGAFTQTRDDEGREYVETLADDYDTLAKNIEAIEGPAVFATEQKALANGYRSVADGLRILKRSTNDANTYENMLTYNTNVESFATSFITFALLFKEQGVLFTENEPGGMFTPPVSQQ